MSYMGDLLNLHRGNVPTLPTEEEAEREFLNSLTPGQWEAHEDILDAKRRVFVGDLVRVRREVKGTT